VPGYEGLYDVSDRGRIRSYFRGRHLCPRPQRVLVFNVSPNGYVYVSLSNRGAQHNFTVHRVVLTAFVGRRPSGMECRHFDGDKTNNRLSNLRWGKSADNYQDKVRHGTASISQRNLQRTLTPAQVVKVRSMLSGSLSHSKIGARFGVTKSAISKIARGVNWANAGELCSLNALGQKAS